MWGVEDLAVDLERRADGGLVTVLLSAVNQHDAAVMHCEFLLRVRNLRLAPQGIAS